MQFAQILAPPTNDNIRELADDEVEPFVQEHELAAVLVYAQWCSFSRALAPQYAALADAYEGRVAFSRIDADASPRYADENDVHSFPTIHIYRGAERIGAIVGFVPPPELRRIFDELGESA